VSRAIPFEVTPTEPRKLVATLVSGAKVEITIKFGIVEVVDNERPTTSGVPDVSFTLYPVTTVRPLDGSVPSAAPPPGTVMVKSGLN
jgi:hypothetical protein